MGTCIHLGNHRREQQCPACQGNVQVKVFDCQRHNEATLAKAVPGIQCCQTCPDRTEVDVAMKTEDIKPGTPVPIVKDLLRKQPVGPWPGGWTAWPSVIAAHRELCDEFARRSHPYPGGFEGCGIVSCVSAKPGFSSGKNLAQGYFPGGWVLAKELRRLGCTLPITFCNLGPSEWDPRLTEMVKPLGVDVIDLREWEKRPGNQFLCLNGWESKLAAVLACPYESALYLDADNVPIKDPSFLFGDKRFLESGAVLWPDLPPYDRAEWLPATVWASVGMGHDSSIKAAESGQYLVSKSKCWHELMVCKWLNEHSPYYFSLVFGDKDCLPLAWNKVASVTGKPARYVMPSTPPSWNGAAILQFDLDGKLLFEHGARNKPTLDGYPNGNRCLTNPKECIGHLSELREAWNGKLWHNEVPTGADATTTRSLLHRTFLYRRVELNEEREIRFLQDNRIGKGAARCEFSWSVIGGVLVVSDIDGAVTFLAKKNGDGRWHGRWEQHEKCEIELVPIETVHSRGQQQTMPVMAFKSFGTADES